MTTPNQVTVFSNGIADFRRAYQTVKGQATEVLLEVKRPHVADVLASLCVFGTVELESPPTFAPSNENDNALHISPSNALEELAQQLSGASVRIERAGDAIEGRLLGLHHEPEASGGQPTKPKYFAVWTATGIVKTPLREVQRLEFLEETVQTEIRKALQRNLESVKPDSAQVRLTLKTAEESAEAIVQYTVPAAAWKISYRLRGSGETWSLQGLAIVDNNTDEDWNDFLVAVVTGEPITFETDLAEAKTPRRSRVNVVREEAVGAVEVEQAMNMAAAAPMAMRKAVGRFSAAEEVEGGTVYGMQMDQSPSAMQSDAVTAEVGDFSIFQSRQPVSIGAGRSAVIPMFEVDLEEAAYLLYFKHTDHAERPYRAIRFTNSAGHSLGRGVCTVYLDDVYSGACIVPATTPEEERMLPHALETGVKALREVTESQSALVRLHIQNGACLTTHRNRNTTEYVFHNNRKEAFTLVVDHQSIQPDSQVECTVQRGDDLEPVTPSKIREGVRIEFSLPPNATTRLEVRESKLVRSQIDFGTHIHADWLQRNVVYTAGPLSQDESILAALAVQQRLSDQQEKLDDAAREIEKLERKQERLRKNIEVGGQNEQANKWRSELGAAEDRITHIEEVESAQLTAEHQALQQELQQALNDIVAEWSEE